MRKFSMMCTAPEGQKEPFMLGMELAEYLRQNTVSNGLVPGTATGGVGLLQGAGPGERMIRMAYDVRQGNSSYVHEIEISDPSMESVLESTITEIYRRHGFSKVERTEG